MAFLIIIICTDYNLSAEPRTFLILSDRAPDSATKKAEAA